MSSLLWNPKFHYCPPELRNLSQINPIHTVPPCFTYIIFNIVLPSAAIPSELPLPFKLSNQNFVQAHLSAPTCASLILLHIIILIKMKSIELLLMQISSASCYLISSFSTHYLVIILPFDWLYLKVFLNERRHKSSIFWKKKIRNRTHGSWTGLIHTARSIFSGYKILRAFYG